MPNLSTLLLAARIGWGAALIGLFGVHHQVMLAPPQITEVLRDTQIATQGQQITDLERRVAILEEAKTSEQLAAIQSQLSIDHQILFIIAGAMLTLSGEALWRISRGKPKE